MLQRVQSWRGTQVDTKSYPNADETLSQICNFLRQHETNANNEVTHQSHQEYGDWWAGSKSTHKLVIVEEGTRETLYNYMCMLFDMGVPLTLAEKCSLQFRFVQDIEIRGSESGEVVKAEEVVNPEGLFLQQIGRVMAELYSGSFRNEGSEGGFLDVYILDGSGRSVERDCLETCIRLVWPKIIVDRERARRIRECQLARFKQSQDVNVMELGDKMRNMHPENEWARVLPDALYMPRSAVQMPFNDRVAPAPMKKAEQRPLKPVCIKRLRFSDAGGLDSIEDAGDATALDNEAWVDTCSIRVAENTPLTDWRPPIMTSERAPRQPRGAANGVVGGFSANNNGGGGPPERAGGGNRGVAHGRGGGEVRIRTMGGSSTDCIFRRGHRDPNKAVTEPNQRAEREFHGTAAEFREHLARKLGEAGISPEGSEGAAVCWYGQDGQSVKFVPGTRRVHFEGRSTQLRILVDKLQEVLQAAGEAARSVVSASRRSGAVTGDGRSTVNGRSTANAQSYAASEVHAPSRAGTNASTLSRQGGFGRTRSTVNTRRRVTIAFMDEENADTTLRLEVGDIVIIKEDPPEECHNLHRWVLGMKLESETVASTEQLGWFPFANTVELESVEE